MQPTKITVGIKEVIASGTVIGFEGKPICVEVGNLKFIFEFVDDDGKAEEKSLFTTPSATELKITLMNIRNPLGTGNPKPLSVGKLNGRDMYLNFRVYDLVGSDKTLHYTLYLEQEVSIK